MRSKDIPYTIAKQAWERDEHPAYSLEFVAAISRLIDAAYKSSVVSSNPMEFARVAYDRCMAGNPF
ncbi:MAG: hypothetical protein KGO48_05890 [Alphaproteobacteria bacterium]|nr:hypothetical protein [Alphaproteobacteria bacterium]